MNDFLLRFKQQAKALVQLEQRSSFTRDLAPELAYCGECFFHNRVLSRLRGDVLPMLGDEYGFGVEHAKRVAIDAGAIVLRECGENTSLGRRLSLLAQVAGLLHDICRPEEDHAQKSAELSQSILAEYPLSPEELEEISRAIALHETSDSNQEYSLVAAALYDADKFRWGLDNFTTTLWEACDYLEWPLEKTIDNYLPCQEKILEFTGSFRSGVGRKYGPGILAQGPRLGLIIHEKLKRCACGA